MTYKLTTELVWDVIVEQIQSGELKTMPCSQMNEPKIGDVICYESNAESGISEGHRWAYVEVKDVLPYRRPGCVVPVDGLKLIVFTLVTDLSSLSAL